MELTDITHTLLYDAQLCSRCKFCSTVCPTNDGWLAQTPVGRLQAILYTISHEDVHFNKLGTMLYSCTLCGACEEICNKFMAGVKIKEAVRLARSYLVEKAVVPSKIRDFLENIYNQGNPYGISNMKRDEWTEGIEIKQFAHEDFLYYVGCVGSYDPVGQRVAKSFSKLLLKAGVSAGILGKREKCEGNEALVLGEEGLFESFAEENIKKFKKLGVKRIVTIDPHAYNALKNDYPKIGGEYEVMHHTQLIWDLLKEGKLKFNVGGTSETKVTYHDPCFLGRWNGIYEEPRNILKNIPGVTLIEMRRNKENSFCCGGGSGNFYTDFSSEGREPGKERVKEAYETGAEVIVTACPVCAVMLEESIVSENRDTKLLVKDISEIVNEFTI
jgi:Fe-S oxidoreductase